MGMLLNDTFNHAIAYAYRLARFERRKIMKNFALAVEG